MTSCNKTAQQMAKWYVSNRGADEQGPLSTALLKRAATQESGSPRKPRSCKEGMESTIPAARVKGLFAAAKDKTAEITPPPKTDET